MNTALKLLEEMIEMNSLEMKIIAFEFIRGEQGNRDLREKFKVLENKNTALNEAYDILFDALEGGND